MTAAADRPAPQRRDVIVRWAVIGVAALIGVVLIYFLMTAFVPRWWAQSIGRQVDGRLGRGIGLGLFYGTVFTALPVLAVAQARRTTWPPARRIAAAIIGVLLTAPNLITLGITIGATRAAQAGDRVLDVEAPGFRYATAAGAVIGTVAGVGIVTFSILYARRTRELKTLRARLAAVEKP